MNTPKQYRKKPVSIEAMRLIGTTADCIDFDTVRISKNEQEVGF